MARTSSSPDADQALCKAFLITRGEALLIASCERVLTAEVPFRQPALVAPPGTAPVAMVPVRPNRNARISRTLDDHTAHERPRIDNALIHDRPSHHHPTLNDDRALDDTTNNGALDDFAANDWSFNHLPLNHDGCVTRVIPLGVPVSRVGRC